MRAIPSSQKTKQHSFTSVRIAIAPATTLNRMYHYVPNDSSAIERMPKAADTNDTQHNLKSKSSSKRVKSTGLRAVFE